MKANEVQPLTTVYRQRRGQYDSPKKAVVLATGNWVALYGDERSTSSGNHWNARPITGYREVTDRDYLGRNDTKGWLVLVATANRLSENAVSSEELLALAQPAFDAVQGGDVPTLPDGVRLVLIRGQEIIDTWAEFLAAEERGRVARQQHEQREAEKREAETAAQLRIAAVVDVNLLREFQFGLRGVSYVALEKLLDAYHAGMSDREVSAQS